jgi:magnesium-protoporphyrin IX monomethyl ester (oxidative) cyclase
MARHKAGVTLEAVRCTVEQVHAAGLRAKGLFIFGLPGETPETFQRTSDFILSLDLDDMNLTKFSPLHGAPLWAECVAGEEGDFNEDWRLLNCVNPVFLPKGFASRDQMETLYNGHIERFYKSKAYQRRFGRSLWEHRWSLWHLVRHLPMVWAAKRYFTSKRESDAKAYERHPRQPVGLKPLPLVH